MYKLKTILLSVVVASPVIASLSAVSPAISSEIPSNAIAQATTQTLGQCVKELNNNYSEAHGSFSKPSDEMNNRYIQICSDLLKTQGANSNQPIQNVQQQPAFLLIPNPGVQQRSPEKFAQCVNQQMYRQKEVCIDPWGGMDETCFYRGRGGKKTVPEPTGITLEQASSTCGG